MAPADTLPPKPRLRLGNPAMHPLMQLAHGEWLHWAGLTAKSG